MSDLRFSGQTCIADFLATLEKKRRKVNVILSAVKASKQKLTTVTPIWGWFQKIYEVQRGSKR